MRPDCDPGFGVVPDYMPSTPLLPRAKYPSLRLTPAEEARLEATTFDELDAALHVLLAECYRQRRAGWPLLVETTTVVRLNGLLALARRMTRGLRRAVDIPDLPETVMLSAAELVTPLERAVLAFGMVNTHRGQPHDPAFRGWPHPHVDPVALAVAPRDPAPRPVLAHA